MTPAEQKQSLIHLSNELGFCAFGVTAVPKELNQAFYYQWIADNMHGEMAWMARDPERRTNPSQVLPSAQSILVLAMNYHQPPPKRRGQIAQYALGKDYHRLMLKRLKQLCTEMRTWGGEQKPYVDTGPILEKPLGALAGIGWQSKNTLLLSKEHGQWLFLGTILTSLPLPPDEPAKDRCGSCTRCLDICPTKAFPAPYQLDARRCISYLTIEHKGPIPLEFRQPIGDHLYGCDDCLAVCPWNKWAQQTREARFQARDYPDLRDMLSWDEATFDHHFIGTPIKRTGLQRWTRNVCIVLGNTGTPDDLPALQKHARGADPLIAEHALWAIHEIEQRNASR